MTQSKGGGYFTIPLPPNSKILFCVTYQTFSGTSVCDSTPDTMSYLMKCTHAIKYSVNMKVGLSLAICLSVW